MKKQLLTLSTLTFFGLSGMLAQNFVTPGKTVTKNNAPTALPAVHRTCLTETPSAEWDVNFNKLVDNYVKEHTDVTGKVSTIPVTIPVVFHIIHNQNSITLENISAAQVASQIAVLNADYAGTNTDISNVPAAFQSVKAGNTDIQFCLAQKDVNDVVMAEPGIDRIKWSTRGWTDPNTLTSSDLTGGYFDNTIKAQSIWDPAKYLNIWVSKLDATGGILGYASFPAASTLLGLTGVETASTSGVVLNVYATGTIGNLYGGIDKGRTATHEVGHWLGLRHISGDAACGDDFCTDTPKQKGGNAGGQGGLNWGCPTYPFLVAGECTGTASATAAGSEMFMDYMDYCDDACLYMFTANQKTRMQTAMLNGTYRKFLGTHGKCSTGPLAPTAAFTMLANGCANIAVTTTNNSGGSPTPTYAWSASPSTGVTFSSTTATAPTITFANVGTYTVTLVATNASGNNSTTQVISITNCTLTQCDTLANPLVQFVNYTTGSNTGYLAGNNQYADKSKAEYHTQGGISGNNVTGMIVYFYKNGNNGTGGTAANSLSFQLFNGNNTTGPSGAAVKSDNVTLGTLATNGVQNQTILAYAHTFSTPYTLTANEFFASVKLPTTAGDTAVIYMADTLDGPAVNTAWEQQSSNSWFAFSSGSAWGAKGSMCIFPIVCPASVGLAASGLNNQISIFPNPSTGVINFAFALNNQSDVKIEVTNMLGQTVYSSIEKGISANTKSINIGDVTKGVYMVTVSTGTDKMVRKIVIE